MTTKAISLDDLRQLSATAATEARLRKNLNVHASLDANVQRLFNAMEPDTYIRPHRHARDQGWELMLAIRGRFAVLFFDETGSVAERHELSSEVGLMAIEVPARTWHSVVSLEAGTVMFEVKEGPYTPVDDKDFALWAPREGESAAKPLLDWFKRAKPGEPAPLTKQLCP